MVCLLLKGHVDHNGKMHALLKRTSFVKEDLFQVICFYIRGSNNQRLVTKKGRTFKYFDRIRNRIPHLGTNSREKGVHFIG